MRFYSIHTTSGFTVVPGDGFYTDDQGNLCVFVGNDVPTAQILADHWVGVAPYEDGNLLASSAKHAADVVEQVVTETVQPPERTDAVPVVVDPGFLPPIANDAADLDEVRALPPSGAIPVVVPSEGTPIFDDVEGADRDA